MTRQLVDVRRLHAARLSRGRVPLRYRAAVLGSAMATVLVAAGSSPAHADRLEWADAAGDMAAFSETSEEVTTAPDHHAGDVTSAILRHGRRAVTMRVAFGQLRRSDYNTYHGKLRTDTARRIYFVEDERNARPRLYLVNKRFARACGRATLDVDYKANTLAMRVPRTCLKRPNWVKATAMSANGPGDEANSFYIDDAFSAAPIDDVRYRPTWSARVHAPCRT